MNLNQENNVYRNQRINSPHNNMNSSRNNMNSPGNNMNGHRNNMNSPHNNNMNLPRNNNMYQTQGEEEIEEVTQESIEEPVEEVEEQQVSIVNNLLNNTITNNTKYHFFIGNIFKNTKQIQDLVNIKKNLKKKLKYSYGINEYHSNYQLSTNLIYLGYFTNSVAKEYMNNVFSNLLNAITQSPNVKALMCEYLNYKIKDDKKYYKVSIEYDDSKNILSKVIIPYLYENGITPIYNKKNYEKPAIDLIYFKKDNMHSKISLSMNLPKNKFMLSSLSLIRGLPTKTRSGTPSTHNQMNLEEVSGFTYKLSE